MYEVLNNDGILIFSCTSTGFLEHGTKRVNPMTLWDNAWLL